MKTKVFFSSLLFICVTNAYSTKYFSGSSGALNLTASWWSNAAGTATPHAPNFTTAGDTFVIVNNASATITANWTVSGAGSIIQVGDGTQTINFSIPTGRTVTATINVMNNGTLTNAAVANPTLGTLAAGSTVDYSDAANQNIVNASYYNLTLSGSGTKSLLNVSNTTITNVLTINTGIIFALSTTNTDTAIITGTISGTGTVKGGASSNLKIGGTGSFGTITPSAAPLTLDNLTINRGGLGSITLGGNVTVNTSCSFSNGDLVLNGNTLTLDGTLTLPTSSANGTITGSATSNLSIGATSITNSLFMDETTPGTTDVLKNFTLNSAGQTLTLGTNLTVSGAYTQTKGIININGNTLTLSGTATFATTTANGTISGSATSNLSISATTITNDFFMTAGSQKLNNFTLNSPGKTLILGAGDTITVSGAYTQTSGTLNLNGQNLALNGTVVFAGSTAGTITGSAASSLTVSATSITNDLFLTGGAQTFKNFMLNSSGQTLMLAAANNLTVSGVFTQTNGTLNLNGNTLTLSGTAVFPVASSNGVITGSSTSIMSITATGISNSLFMDQTTPGTTNVLKNITLNSAGQTLTLGNSLTVSGAYAQTKGIVSISAGSTLSLTGTATFPTTSANGTISGTTTSNLSISATTITNDLFMTAGSQQLGNFTLNSAGKTLTLGAGDAITISGIFTQTNGIISLGAGNSLTLNGSVVFPAASANGTITGTTTSSLSISATSITNDLFMTAGSQKLSGFTLNSPGQTLTLGAANNITVSGPFNQTNGNLNLNGNTLTLSGTAAFPAASSNGVITGSATSALSITATSLSGSLSMDQTTPGTTNELKTFTLNSSGQTLTLGGNMVIISGGTYTHTNGIINLNGNTLTLNGAVTFPAAIANGSFTGSSTSSINVGGAGAITNDLFMTQTSSSTNSLSNLTLNRTGKTITLGNALNVIDSISPTLGTIAGGGNITLIADQVNVGHVGRVGKVGGTLTGNITSQVFHNPPPGNTTNWMLMGTAGVTNATFAQWNSSFQITCPAGCTATGVGGTAFNSLTTFSEPTGTFPAITGTTSVISPGVGYWVFLGTSSPGTTSASELVTVTGTPETGTFTWPVLTNSGVGSYPGNNLIANPYPSPISWNKVKADPLNAAAFTANPSLSTIDVYSTTYNNGDYLTYNASSGVSVPAYVAGSNSIADVIPAGMGFYVITTAASTTLKISESDKVSGNNQNFLFRQANPNSVQSSSIPYFSLAVTGGSNSSEAALSFSSNATLGFDAYDSPALAWNSLLQISTQSLGKNYTINGLPALTQNYTIPVQILSGTTTQYTLTPLYLNNIASGACLNLHDNYTNTNYDLRAGAISLTINDTELTVPRFVLTITVDTSLSVTGNFHNPTCANSGNGYMVATPTTASPWNYYWKDANNNIIKTSLNKTTADTLNNANAGFYHVDVNTTGTCSNGTATFTLQGTVSPTALFTTPSATVTLVNDTVSVSFTNTSTNANNYIWNFGDGTQATYTNTSHQYTNAGVYVVSLMAVNQLCGDTATYTQVIIVDTAATAGIKTFAANQNNMLISRDAAGYYVQFNYTDKTNAVISVQNLLGERVVADINQEGVSNNRTYIPLGNTNNNVLIISVITTAGEKTFRKVINSN